MVMETFSKAAGILLDSVSEVWHTLVRLIPSIFAALVVVFVGWVIGKILRKLLEWILVRFGADRWIKREGLSPAVWGRNLSSVLGGLLKWYVIVVFAAEALSLIQSVVVVSLMHSVKPFIHITFGAFALFIVASLVAERIKKMIAATGMTHSKTVGGVAKFLLLYFILVLILQIMGLNTGIFGDVFKIAFTAFAITIAIIVGIGFGLAFSDDARSVVDSVRKKKK